VARRWEDHRVSFDALPASAAWSHQGLRSGFEVTYVESFRDGWLLTGCTAAVEVGQPWIVDYEISVDADWVTRTARVRSRSRHAARTVSLKADGYGHWWVGDLLAPDLDGCFDVDLESSALTNALPVHRLRLAPGGRASAPAAFVRALDLSVTRLQQGYTRLDGGDVRQRYGYTAPAFDFSCELAYDETGLVLTYPGIAVRAG
jgi:uncharacterized protein